MALPVPGLPSLTQLLPEGPFKSFVQYGTYCTQTPDGMMAVNALGAAGSAINGKFEIARRDGSVDKAQYYFISVGSPGDGQSRCVSIATKPIHSWLKMQMHKYNLEWPEGSDNPPPPPRMYFEDITPTAITRLLEKYNGKIVLHTAEGGMLDGFTRWPGLIDNFCKTFVGEDLWLDRANKAPTFVESPAVSFSVMAKSDTVIKFLRNKSARDKGLCGRCLMMSFHSIAGYRNIDVPAIPKSSMDDYEDIILKLLNLPSPPPGERHQLGLDSGADRVFLEYRRRIEIELQPRGSLSFDEHWGKKYHAKVLQIAALLHCIKRSEPLVGLIDEETVCESIAIADNFAAHARSLFLWADFGEAADIARKIVEWVNRSRCESFTAKEARNALPQFNIKEVNSGIEFLRFDLKVYEDWSAYDQHKLSNRRGPNPATRFRLFSPIMLIDDDEKSDNDTK